MKFSIVLATRKRVNLLKSFLRSIRETTADIDSVEVIAVYDLDDKDMEEDFSEFEFLTLIGRERSRRLNEDYINLAARQSTGEYIFILNDDVEFKTMNWDYIAYEKLTFFTKDNPVVYAMTDDGLQSLKISQNKEYSCFPIISRKSMDILDYAMHPLFNSWGADMHLFRVYLSVGRILDLREIKVIHISYHGGLRERDETSYNTELISHGTPDPMSIDIRDDCKKLLKLNKIVKTNKSVDVAQSTNNKKLESVLTRYRERIKNLTS